MQESCFWRKVSVFLGPSEFQHLQEAHKVGIRGFIQKGAGFQVLIDGIEALLHGDSFFSPESEM